VPKTTQKITKLWIPKIKEREEEESSIKSPARKRGEGRDKKLLGSEEMH